jgi:prepilin-type N-terminal cleavage/methylation domain-containing protein
MKNKLQKGFTLIELLVVIAIIGILASVVLTSVQNARSGARESAIKSALSQYRVQMEQEYDEVTGYLDPSNAAFTNLNDNIQNNGSAAPVGAGDVDGYAVMAQLPDGTGWCVDSEGHNDAATWDASFNATVCP